MAEEKKKTVFVQGAITPQFIANTIAQQQTKTTIGAHDIFLGQIRADEIDGKTVTGIEYTAYESMAANVFETIHKKALHKYDITSVHIHHSIGLVKTSELCLFVLVCAPHRRVAFEALAYVVEAIKADVPVFGKEILEDQTHAWKVNT